MRAIPNYRPEQRFARHLSSMIPGTVGATVKSARLFHPRAFRGIDPQPSDPPVIVEYDGANLSAAEGAEPTSWPDTSGNGYDAVPAGVGSEYDYDSTLINGQPGVRHVSGSRSYSYEPISPSRTDSDLTAMVVAEIMTGATQTGFFLNGGTAPDEYLTLTITNSGVTAYSAGNSYNTEATATDVADYSGAHLFVVVRNSTGLYLRVDGVEVASDLTAVEPSEWDFTLFESAHGGGLAFAKAWAGELVDLAGTEADLMTRFGL